MTMQIIGQAQKDKQVNPRNFLINQTIAGFSHASSFQQKLSTFYFLIQNITRNLTPELFYMLYLLQNLILLKK